MVAIPNVAAIWEGGSVATGFSDQYSDLDLLIVTHANDPEPVFVALETFWIPVMDSAAVSHAEPSWHGLSQSFTAKRQSTLLLSGSCGYSQSQSHKLTEPDRHGNANVWYDSRADLYFTSHGS